MKRIMAWLVAIMFFIGVMPVFGADNDKANPTPNKEAYEHANEHARFMRTEASKSNIKAANKSDNEAEKEKKRLDKEAKKKQEALDKEAKKKQKEAQKAAKKIKK